MHLLHAVPQARGDAHRLSGGTDFAAGRAIEVIEDLLPLHDVGLSVRVPARIERVALEPQGRELPFEEKGGRIAVRLDRVECHQMVVFYE